MKDVRVEMLDAHATRGGVDLAVFAKHPGDFHALKAMHVFSGPPRAWYNVTEPLAMACLSGMVEVVLFDARRDSPTFGSLVAEVIGAERPAELYLPVGIQVGWQALGGRNALLLAGGGGDFPGDPAEPADTDRIPFDWAP